MTRRSLLPLAAFTVAAAATTLRAAEPEAVAPAVSRGLELLLGMQEGGKGGAEWPYEGVYRVRGVIPIGYRVGGTAIVATSLVEAPGLAEDALRMNAVDRATRFVVASIAEPLMQHEAIEASYDVRGWGYAYGLWYLTELERRDLVPEDLEEETAGAIEFFIAGIAATEIPERGGWNYARRRGFDQPGAPSPFMTGSTLRALFSAAERGHAVEAGLVERGLDALESARTPTGSFVYAGSRGASSRESVPGSVGRMLVSESTLLLGGRGSIDRLRGAVDAFIVHWEWLEQRRQQTGTHIAPYGIAPYYFYYAHYFAADAIELLPEHERAEYRRKLHELIFRTREEDGGWNDRVFDRSANYGTAMSIMALLRPELPPAPRWAPPAPAAEPAP